MINTEDIALQLQYLADKVILEKQYNTQYVELVLNRSDMYLKYKNQRVGTFSIFLEKVKYQHEIPHNV